MQIFLDTAKVDEIRKWKSVIAGVTTNPSILLKDGGNIYDLCNEVGNLPISLEACGDFKTDAIKYSQEIPGCNIKIPLLRPNGGHNLDLIAELSDQNIDINCTALFSLSQVILATKAGARYVSLFYGRIADEGGYPGNMISDCMDFLMREDADTELIIGSIRGVGDVLDSTNHDADIITIPPAILQKMVSHAYSRETVQMFERDNEELQKLSKVQLN